MDTLSACYDHLGGPAGARLTERFLELGWVTPEPHPGVTPAGWAGLTELGLNLTPLTSGRRKPVAYCADQPDGADREHLGGHLGALVRQHFLRNGWMRAVNGELEMTAEGEQMLRRLGVNLEERS